MGRLLIVVDYQNDFVDGALGFPGAEKLDQPIADKIAEYRAAGDEIVFTFDTHGQDYLETLEGINLPVPHCIEGTEGHGLYGAVAQSLREGDKTFMKSTFGSNALFSYLSELQEDFFGKDVPFESIELVGLVSNICVISNAVLAKTACPNVPVVVDALCTASFDEGLNAATLDVMEGLQIKVINR